MYIVLVGPPGRCRKGTAMNLGIKFLEELGVNMTAESITREALIKELEKSSDTIQNDKGELVTHSSITIHSQELTVFLGYNNLTLLADLTDWYDCKSKWEYRTKNMGSNDITGIYVNLIGATTPDLIQTTLPRDAIGGGLSSRMVFVYAENKNKTIPIPSFSKKQLQLKEKLQYDLEQILMLNGKFQVTEDFIEPWIKWYSESDAKPRFNDAKFSGYNERRAAHVMKLCMIISASCRDDLVINNYILQRAIDTLERAEKDMPRVFAGFGEGRSSSVISHIMTTIAREKEITEDRLLNKYYYDIDNSEQFTKIMDTLKKMNFCTEAYSDKKGTFYKYNPDNAAYN